MRDAARLLRRGVPHALPACRVEVLRPGSASHLRGRCRAHAAAGEQRAAAAEATFGPSAQSAGGSKHAACRTLRA
jgi:hypothetical protein